MFTISRDPSAAVGLPSRRSACDRCRGQKLRCLRVDPEQERCDRCAKADAVCLTTPTLSNSNNLPDEHNANAASRKRPRRSPAGQIPVAYANGSASSSSIDVFQQSYSGVAGGQNSQAGDSSVFNAGFLDGLDEILYPPEAVPGLASTCDFSANQSYPSFNNDGPYNGPGRSPAHASPESSRASQKTPSARNGSTAGLALGGLLVDSQDENTCLLGAPAPDDYFARLLHLNLDMVGQLGRISHGPPTVDMDYLITPADETDPKSKCPVDDIMASTRDLIEVLELMPRASNLPPSPSDHPPANSQALKTTAFPARRRSALHMLATPQESLVGEPPSEPECAVDVTVLLLVLNCYTHVLRLYVVLFFHISDFLNELAESEDPTLCAIPGLAFGTFPLSSGNLQATVFTQIATSLFEKLESLVGLPREFRISQRIPQHGDRNPALFSEEDVTSIAKLVASKDEIGKPENGRGGVNSLRKYMKKVTQLLRESIAP